MTIQTLAAAGAPEPIDVVRIRLTRPSSATVVVSEFRMANRVLAEWAGKAAPACADVSIDYEVVFFDGYRLRGCHELLRRGRCEASLSRVVRRLFKGMLPGVPEPTRYLVDG